MTQEDKQLLLKDLSARLPYGVKVRINSKPRKVIGVYDEYVVVKGKTDGETSWDNYGVEEYNIKPYLRPLSSMTEEEEGMYNLLQGISHLAEQHWTANDGKIYRYADAIDWLNEHHFDYRGLIEKGLALEAPEGMYKND